MPVVDPRTRIEAATQASLGAYVDARVSRTVLNQVDVDKAFTDIVATVSWAATTTYAFGDRIIPGTPNGHYYRCTVPGTSSGSTPTFPTGSGATVTDGTVTWREDGLVPVVWAVTTAKAVGDYVVPTAGNGHKYRCIVAGTTSGSQPTWPTDTNKTVVDGTVTWQESGIP